MRNYLFPLLIAAFGLIPTLAQAQTWEVPTELSPTTIQTSVMAIIGPALAVLIPLTLAFLIVALIVRTVKRGAAKTAK